MIKPVPCAALLLALSTLWVPAHAQNVYRCGESYSNAPCPGATVVPTDDPRSPAQRAQTEAAARRDARSAQELEHERLKQEGKPVQATILAPAAAKEPSAPVSDRTASKAKPRKPELFTAVAPKKPGDADAKKKKKKKKAAKAPTA
jgi:hypothetical protein